jgi:hypothetical protein
VAVRATTLPKPRAQRDRAPSWALDAFGLQIRSDLPLAGATRSDSRGIASRPVLIRPLHEGPPPAREETTVLERRHPDGSLGMRVARLDDGAYLIDAPGHGRFYVAEDGSLVRYDRLADEAWRWHRPLCAQALPLAAALHDLELFHASAVAFDGCAIAFVAASGTGKTSLAVALMARGAALVTDDVLALEPERGGVTAHPGVPLGNVAADQLARLPAAARARLGAPLGVSDKVHVEISDMASGPLPLGAVCFLSRSGAIERPSLTPAAPPDPRDLLAATFMPHIVTRARLISQLSTCAEIAAAVPVVRLEVPAKVSADRLARELEHVLPSVLAW